MRGVNEPLWFLPHLKTPSCTTKFCFSFSPTAGNWLRALLRRLSAAQQVRFLLLHCRAFFFWVGWGWLGVKSYGCFLVICFGMFFYCGICFFAASGSLLGYFLIKSHFAFVTSSALEITSWSQAPTDHPRQHFGAFWAPPHPSFISCPAEHISHFQQHPFNSHCFDSVWGLFWYLCYRRKCNETVILVNHVWRKGDSAHSHSHI